ncbi:unnamed protein product [Urochloa humidicola]
MGEPAAAFASTSGTRRGTGTASGGGEGGKESSSSYQRNGYHYDMHRWRGFFVTIWIAVVMFKSNDTLRKQTALKCRGREKFQSLSGLQYCLWFTYLDFIGATRMGTL